MPNKIISVTEVTVLAGKNKGFKLDVNGERPVRCGQLLHGTTVSKDSKFFRRAMRRFMTISILMLTACTALAQQQSQTLIDSEGNKTVLDVKTGWTMIEKGGKTQTFGVAEVTKLCDYNERFGKTDQPDDRTIAVLCDEWWKLQPKVEIERLPFKSLVRRLLLESRESTNFARYRGMEVKSGQDSTTYDAGILPNDVGQDVSCTIDEENRHDLGLMCTYRCEIKTSSFPAALQMKDKLVLDVKDFNLKEDEIREHGLLVTAKDMGLCAPSGECLQQHVYATTMQSWKMLQIEANPVLTRDTIAELHAKQNGKDVPPNGIAANSGTVWFEIFSIGPQKKH